MSEAAEELPPEPADGEGHADDAGDDDEPLLAPQSGRRAAPAGALILSAGMFLTLAFTSGNTFLEGFTYMFYFGIIGLPVIFAVGLFTFRGLERALRSARGGDPGPWASRVVVIVAVVASGAMVAYGYEASRPISRFRSFVLDPAPASLSDLRVVKTSTVGEGGGWFVAFDVSPEDFETIRAARKLTPADARFDATPPPDESLRRYGGGQYSRPADVRLFLADRLTVVTDAARSRVFMFFDQFERNR